MAMGNGSAVTEFILAGITDQPQLQLPFFFLFFLNYLVTAVGNFSLINLIFLTPHLHMPMYFFLLNLSIIDLCHSLIITPKMLISFVAENVISFAGCMTQLFFFCFFVHTECYVLTAMAYDRYAAICRPLTYTATMSPQLCCLLVLGSYVLGFAGAMVHTGGMLRLSFCEANVIHHYMCDIFPLLQLSCSSTHVNELVDSTVVSVVVIASSLVIVISYALILSNILHMASSSQGLSKAFSTCGSHIATVALFYGSGMFTHLKTSPNGSPSQGRFFSVFYTNVVPMLNPLIYSLRNKDVKLALKKTLKKMAS